MFYLAKVQTGFVAENFSSYNLGKYKDPNTQGQKSKRKKRFTTAADQVTTGVTSKARKAFPEACGLYSGSLCIFTWAGYCLSMLS